MLKVSWSLNMANEGTRMAFLADVLSNSNVLALLRRSHVCVCYERTVAYLPSLVGSRRASLNQHRVPLLQLCHPKTSLPWPHVICDPVLFATPLLSRALQPSGGLLVSN